jgi:hypothetical protein
MLYVSHILILYPTCFDHHMTIIRGILVLGLLLIIVGNVPISPSVCGCVSVSIWESSYEYNDIIILYVETVIQCVN